jgi:hypothetical protein
VHEIAALAVHAAMVPGVVPASHRGNGPPAR